MSTYHNSGLVSPSPEPDNVSSQFIDRDVEMELRSPSPSNFAVDNSLMVDSDSEIVTDKTSDNVANTSPTFTLHNFRNLPASVRRRIFALNLPTNPRLVEAIWMEGKREDGWYCNNPIIVNLSINRESRMQALKVYPISFRCHGSPARIPFNFERDTLFLGRNMRGTGPNFKRERFGSDLAKVQRLMVDASVQWGKREKGDPTLSSYDRDDRGNSRFGNRGIGNLGELSHLIFSGVKEHTVLYTGLSDPLPFWAESSWFPRLALQRASLQHAGHVIARYKQLWPHAPGRIQLPPSDADAFRYGGIPESAKYDPAIGFWEIPKIFFFGVSFRVQESFGYSEECNWSMILMDRVIEDIFF